MKLSTLLLALAGTSGFARAQTVLFAEDFEAGLDDWTIESAGAVVFHDIRVTHPCAEKIAPFPSAHHAVRAGLKSECTFNDQNVVPYTTLSQTQAIDLPAGATDLRLTYWCYAEGEDTICDYDRQWVYLSDDGGNTWTLVGTNCAAYPWRESSHDITGWAGSSVLIRFEFDALDFTLNGGLGWVIDDVVVVMDSCGVTENYCVGAPNSAGPGAVMGWSGSTTLFVDDFTLEFSGGPPNQYAHFFYGPDPNQIPVADGFLCVGAGAMGFVRLMPSGKIDGSGFLSRKLDMYAQKFFTPRTLYFQAWYRDPSGGPAGSNFTDGLRVTFCD